MDLIKNANPEAVRLEQLGAKELEKGNKEEAAKLFLQSAEMGFPIAMYDMGLCNSKTI